MVRYAHVVEEGIFTLESDEIVAEMKESSEFGTDDGDPEVGAEGLMSAQKVYHHLCSTYPPLLPFPRTVIGSQGTRIVSGLRGGRSYRYTTREQIHLTLPYEGEELGLYASLQDGHLEDAHRIGLEDTLVIRCRTRSKTELGLHRCVVEHRLARSCPVALDRDVTLHDDIEPEVDVVWSYRSRLTDRGHDGIDRRHVSPLGLDAEREMKETCFERIESGVKEVGDG